MKRAAICLLSLAFLVTGCGADGAADEGLDGHGFPYRVDFRVWEYATGEAELYACLYRHRRCEQAGFVQVRHGGQTVTLEDVPGALNDSSTGWLTSTEEAEPFVFTWPGTREQPVVTAEVTLADAFTIETPLDGSTVSATSPMTVEWTEGSTEALMAWGRYAECPEVSSDFDHLVPDSGSVEISAAQLALSPGCSSNLWLERLRRGSTSSPLANIVASRARYVELTVGP
jgi:hypothetical protein